ncbi:hypothetical protein SO802_022066 [Lithocarpus litseifolius]|uniref:DDE Tnp4 domain-containing protein n=1 Tax=Lithocarpus litseifolius TaxID=425828 RepID=A0AAW2CLH8_9ROSI
MEYFSGCDGSPRLGKYYICDAGHEVRKGVLPLYHGVRYHLKEFSDHPPMNERELFNLCLTSSRTTIEHCFGVLKTRLRVLDAKSFWSFETQVNVVLACGLIHKHIVEVDTIDPILDAVNRDTQYESCGVQQTQRETLEEIREWVKKRDEICLAMWEDYNARESD